jgi:MscS family membrane protein
MMDIIEQAGSAMAFPSQTLYLKRDDGIESNEAKGAEAGAQRWQRKGTPA